jgi:hypothetical protein
MLMRAIVDNLLNVVHSWTAPSGSGVVDDEERRPPAT